MFKKFSIRLTIGLAGMLLLVACQRSASQAPLPTVSTPTRTVATGQQPTGMGQIQMIGTTQMIQTMTAISQATNPGGSLPTITLVGTPVTPNTFTLVAPTGVATTPAPGITPVVLVPTSTPGHPSSYTLMPGEYIYCIARRFNVDQNELLSLNGLTLANANDLQPGDSLNIPQTGNPFVGERSLQSHPTSYTVTSPNETIYKVACAYGNLDPVQIITANGLTSPYTLQMNQTLNIP
jgi:LysM repeat protein